MTGRQRLAALYRIERSLDRLTDGHSGDEFCHCDLCDALITIWRVRKQIQQPGRGVNPVNLGMTKDEAEAINLL